MTDPVLAFCLADRDAFLARLTALIREPSVSTDPAFEAGMEGARRLLETRLKAAGFQKVRRLDAGGHPALYAEWLDAPVRPTFLVYGHYDVQPPDPVDRWVSPPFEPTVRDGRLYGRGASDDKGPASIAIDALAAFLAVEGALPVNVKILIEGEEEIGSASLPGLLARHRDLLGADAVISADGARWRPDLDTVNVGCRGTGGLEITFRTAKKPLHSGRYGGIVPNALHDMARLIAGLHDRDGRIAVAGFYDGIEAPTDEERAAIAAIPFDEPSLFASLGTEQRGEAGFSALERLWLRPTLDVNGLWGGYQGTGDMTVIPNEAYAKITMRLVPGQDPARVRAAVESHLTASCPSGATIEMSSNRGWTAAYELPVDHPLLLAVEHALAEPTGEPPLRVRIGASLPLTEIVKCTLGIDTVMFSFGIADEDFHAPNEFFRLSSIDEGFRGWVALLRRLGTQTPADYAAFRSDVGR
ncbi:MAG: dipeptidase [Geminicoccaceae bacterium]